MGVLDVASTPSPSAGSLDAACDFAVNSGKRGLVDAPRVGASAVRRSNLRQPPPQGAGEMMIAVLSFEGFPIASVQRTVIV